MFKKEENAYLFGIYFLPNICEVFHAVSFILKNNSIGQYFQYWLHFLFVGEETAQEDK